MLLLPQGIVTDGPHAIGSGEDVLLLDLNGHLSQSFIEGARCLLIKVEAMKRFSGRLEVLRSSDVLIIGFLMFFAGLVKLINILRPFEQFRETLVLFFVKNSAGRFSKHHIFPIIVVNGHIGILGLVDLEGVKFAAAGDLIKGLLGKGGLLLLYELYGLAAFGPEDSIEVVFAYLILLDFHDSLDDLAALGEALRPLDYHLINLIIRMKFQYE